MAKRFCLPPTVFSLAWLLTCFAQESPAGLLKAAGLQTDVSILRQAFESLHPGLYRYNTKAEMDSAFAELSLELDHDASLQDSFLAFSEFAAKIRCGHTQVNPFNQSKEVIAALFKAPARVPFYFQWLDRRMIVTRDFTPGNRLPEGTEILSIDGESVQRILTSLMRIARADGANDSKRVAQLAVTGRSEYEAFDLYFPMFYPISGSRFEFVAQLPGTTGPTHVSAAPVTFAERLAAVKRSEEQRKLHGDALFDAKRLSKGSLYLKMPTWALYNSKWDWRRWLSEQLDGAAETRAPALILDIRGNEGGDDVGSEVLRHFIDAPIAWSAMTRLVRYRRVPGNLLPYLDTWDKSFRDWGASAQVLRDPWPTAPSTVPYLKLTSDGSGGAEDVIKPTGRRFSGKLIVLIDAANSSATFQFAEAVRLHDLGTLIGEPSGGSQRGINGGAFFFLRLPHSGIELDLPLIGTFPPDDRPDAGVMPDLLIHRTAEDVANGRDPELSAALGLAQERTAGFSRQPNN